MRLPPALLAALALLALPRVSLAQHPLPDNSPPSFKLVLIGEGEPVECAPGEAGLRSAIQALVAKFYTRAMQSASYNVVVAFFTPTFYAKMQEAASTSNKKAFRIELKLEGGRWPRAVLQNDGEKRIELGEGAISGRSLEDLKAALLHECGHLGDDAFCGTVDYGADATHYLEEVISPSGAFFEGWGNLQELLYAPYSPKIANEYLGEKPMVELYAEKPGITRSTSFSAGYVRIPDAELTLTDFVANESFVANVLYAITQVAKPGLDSLQVVVDASRATEGRECRTLYDVLGALTKANPEYRDDVLGIVKKHSTVAGRATGDDAEYQALVDGSWTSPRLTHARPRPSYTPPADPATLGQ